MTLFQKLIDLLKKLGILQAEIKTKTYRNSKDKDYEVDADPGNDE